MLISVVNCDKCNNIEFEVEYVEECVEDIVTAAGKGVEENIDSSECVNVISNPGVVVD